MLRGGSTFPNLTLLSLANNLNIELPMMKLGETLWLNVSTMPQKDYVKQFTNGLKLKEDLSNKRELDTRLLSKTFFDPFLSAKDVLRKAAENKLVPKPYVQIYESSPANNFAERFNFKS